MSRLTKLFIAKAVRYVSKVLEASTEAHELLNFKEEMTLIIMY
jgi:hypothetical protein